MDRVRLARGRARREGIAALEVPAGLTLETDVSAASWTGERLLPSGGSAEGVLVGEIVPSGFAAYVRILHPAHRPTAAGERLVRWAELAEERGTRIHPRSS